MKRLVGALRFAAEEFGPLIVFWGLALAFGVKAAIAGAVATMLADAAWRRWRAIPFTRLYLLVSALTLIFGAVDLMATTPFMLKYEGAFTNLATGAAFVAGALGSRPMMWEVAEQRVGEAFPRTEEVRGYFRILTLVWAGYFLLKAALYAYIAFEMATLQAMALRSVIGAASLAAMVAVSVTQGRRLFLALRGLGWLPPPIPIGEGK